MSNVKKTLLSLAAAAAIAALSTGGTFAVFTDTEDIPANPIDSGDVSVDLSDGDVMNVDDMVIGDTETGTITITNDGDNKASYALTGDAVEDALNGRDLAPHVNITITDPQAADNVLVDESLATFNARTAGIGVVLEPTGVQVYDVEIELLSIDDGTTPVNEDNSLENLGLVQSFAVDAEQRAGEDRTGDEAAGAEALDSGEGVPTDLVP